MRTGNIKGETPVAVAVQIWDETINKMVYLDMSGQQALDLLRAGYPGPSVHGLNVIWPDGSISYAKYWHRTDNNTYSIDTISGSRMFTDEAFLSGAKTASRSRERGNYDIAY